jgi:hypothetical protein
MSLQMIFPLRQMDRKTKLLEASVNHLNIKIGDVWGIAEIVTDGDDENQMTIKRKEGTPLSKNFITRQKKKIEKVHGTKNNQDKLIS